MWSVGLDVVMPMIFFHFSTGKRKLGSKEFYRCHVLEWTVPTLKVKILLFSWLCLTLFVKIMVLICIYLAVWRKEIDYANLFK